MRNDVKKFVRENKPAKLNGGYFDGKELFIPADQGGRLLMAIPSTPDSGMFCKATAALTPTTSSQIKVAIYLETTDRYNWRFAGLT